MLEKIDKIAPYVALALMGYLCHSVMSPGVTSRAQGKEDPLITEQLLRPELVVPEAHASPVTRDPFDVRWASYREDPGFTGEFVTPTDEDPSAGDGSGYFPEDGDRPPPLPTGLKGLLLGDSAQFVVVGDRVCKPGDLVSGEDPRRSWVVERVDVDGVVLRFGDVCRKVQLTTTEQVGAMPTSAPSEDSEQ